MLYKTESVYNKLCFPMAVSCQEAVTLDPFTSSKGNQYYQIWGEQLSCRCQHAEVQHGLHLGVTLACIKHLLPYPEAIISRHGLHEGLHGLRPLLLGCAAYLLHDRGGQAVPVALPTVPRARHRHSAPA